VHTCRVTEFAYQHR